MFATPAYAQAAQGGGAEMLTNIIPFVLIFVILYLMVIRPQQKRAKQHREMVLNLRRGDTVVTNGGLIGKVARVADAEVLLDLGDNVRVRMLRSAVSEVRGKTEPAAEEDGDGTGDKPARKGRGGKSGKAAKVPEQAAAGGETTEQDKPA